MPTEILRTAEDYLSLRYNIVISLDEDGDYVARICELEGCSSHGNTAEFALLHLREVQRLWIQDAIESGDSVPLPRKQECLPSGKWVQRVSRSLHRDLIQMAQKEEVSLNQLVTSILSRSAGISTRRRRRRNNAD